MRKPGWSIAARVGVNAAGQQVEIVYGRLANLSAAIEVEPFLWWETWRPPVATTATGTATGTDDRLLKGKSTVPNRFYTRKFLNSAGHHGGAYILASVEDTRRGGAKADPAWVDFELADCARRVSLDFPLGAAGRANSLRKARLLLATVAAFVDALEAQAALAADRDPKRARR